MSPGSALPAKPTLTDLINALVEFEKKVEELKKETIQEGSKRLLDIGEEEGREMARYAEELAAKIIAEIREEVEREKKRLEELKSIERKSILERLSKMAEENREKAVRETLREALRLLGYEESA